MSVTATITNHGSTESRVPLPGRINHAAYPPVERFDTVDGLLQSHARDSEQKPLICYPISGASDFEERTAADLDRYTDAATKFYIDHGLEPVDPSRASAPAIALLSPSSFEVILTIFALNRLGYAILFLSTRLTAEALARLMDIASAHKIIRSDTFSKTVSEISDIQTTCQAVPVLRRQDWHNILPSSPYHQDPDTRKAQGKRIAWILHSSGSTGFPKPIFLTNHQCLANFRKSFGLRGFCASPLFHSGGLMELFRGFYTRATYYVGNHSLPVTSRNLLAAMQVAKPKLVCAVPYVLKLLAEKDEGIKALAAADIVLFNGSGCPDDLGDRLVANGVNLVANYGATETGQLMTSFRSPGDTEWAYMRLWPPVADHVLMDEISPGVFEAVALDGLPSKGPSNSNPPYSAKNPANSFRTADLFSRHPDPKKSNYYKYLSRLDDRITLVMGEKVLPLPMEGRIRQEDIVREAVVFGYQQAVPGVLIFRPPEHGRDLTDEAYVDAVWPAIEAANSKAESFAHILRDLVVVKGPDVDYPKTDKGTFIRAQVYQQFDADIKASYEKLDAATQNDTKLALSVQELEEWLLARFQEDLKVPLPDTETDIFSAGVDSLQSTRIWSVIKRNLDLGVRDSALSQNIVFEKGTVAALAQHLYQLRTGVKSDAAADELDVMHKLIEKYSHFPVHSPSLPAGQSAGDVVLVTGGTGNLGAFIIAELCRRRQVSEVWALVRAPDQAAALTKQTDALASRNITLSAHQISKLHAVPTDLSQPDLGLPQEVLDHLLTTLTAVIHSAWAVNFNLGVRSFEQHHIRGTHNLLTLCLHSRLPSAPEFYFCSSVSTASGTPKPASIPESTIQDLNHAQATGYGRSKLVAEHITRHAMRQTGLHARILRIGQLSGDRGAAYWNDTEAIALMIRSVLITGSLPALRERPSWLPVDDCAGAVVDIAVTGGSQDSEEAGEAELVYHLVNPQTFSWSQDLIPAVRKVPGIPDFEVVGPEEWLKRLEKSEQDPVKNPSVKLLDFWRTKYGGVQASDAETTGLVFETTRTVRACPRLGEVRDPVSEALVGRYVEVWLRKWAAA
ncbi:Acetyl CoA synthetase-like protein [Teratosphaeria destructans]|uniref:Acetyl CoA synthetase-like protein n=1 Tax=Teratosphaeria destructans TaxID=418781 RepID=A0A9W7SVA4_9PEZI|nr:Acetyl CoA synthetase-like protein [Teratosphaeria destructans]